MKQVLVGHDYKVLFLDVQENIIFEIVCDDIDSCLDEYDIQMENQDNWPVGAVEIVAREIPVYRQAMYGIDYGKGSIKNKFGGMKVPRGAYQYRG